MRAAKRAIASLAVIFVGFQLIPAARSNPPEIGSPQAPTAVLGLLKHACYDCHSNETRWPWYSYVAPVSWMVSRHVTEARRRLNFSEWAAYASDPNTASHKLTEVADQVSNGKMAPWYYCLMNPHARLTSAEREQLIRWARTSAAAMKSPD